MAAVTVVKARYVTPVNYEVIDKCVLSEAVVAGDQLVFTGTVTNGLPVMSKAPTAGITEAHGMAIKDGYAAQEGFEVLIQGEMDGFSGLTPGNPIYPSTATAGKLDTTAIASATVRVRAIRATRIRVSYV
ncbi:MAG TPA: hypothetical protein VEY08_00950 [Chloroflexia bacterium]|nr:hypothetical protein [Chloroflexia bacterium]